MSNIDKQSMQAVADLKAGYTLGHADVVILNELARIALAAMQQEPVAMRWRFLPDGINGMGEWNYRDQDHIDPLNTHAMSRQKEMLYTAPPAPVSVPDFGALTKCIVQRLVDYGAADDDAIASAEEFVYNACHAAMLQGKAEPVSNRDELNYQVIPDGWVMVPKEITDAIGEAIAMQANCCGGIALDIYDAMLAAAPQQ